MCKLKRGLVLNAGNKLKDLDHIKWLKEEYFSKKSVEFDYRESEQLLALQGPKAAEFLQKLVK